MLHTLEALKKLVQMLKELIFVVFTLQLLGPWKLLKILWTFFLINILYTFDKMIKFYHKPYKSILVFFIKKVDQNNFIK
jgi:hypothetical protein